MARIRTIKPDIWQDEFFGTMPPPARLLWIGLITQADDDGRLRGNAALLNSTIFPYDGLPAKRINDWLATMEQGGLIERYVVRGETFISISKWSKHQVINKAKPSVFPAPPSTNGNGHVPDNDWTVD